MNKLINLKQTLILTFHLSTSLYMPFKRLVVHLIFFYLIFCVKNIQLGLGTIPKFTKLKPSTVYNILICTDFPI